MRLLSQDGKAYLSIEPGSSEPDASARRPAHVEAAGYGFAGAHPAVWLSGAELDAFLRGLQTLEATRRGGAQLTSRSHGHFALELRAIETTGRVLATIRIERLADTSGQVHRHSTAFDFEVDASALPSWVAAFRELRTELETSRS